MTVKRADHAYGGGDDDEGAGGGGAAADALDISAALAARAKKGKLRIKKDGLGHGGNARVVFDEDGRSMAPLEALGDRGARGISRRRRAPRRRAPRRTTTG